jgi:hypothetical protein
MTAPAPTAQDDEREQLPDLRCDETKFWHAQLAERDETIRTQSAELAALRAQAEGLRTRFRAAFLYQTKDELSIHIKTDGLDLSFIKPGTFKEGCWTELLTALATPQPVAKETKP